MIDARKKANRIEHDARRRSPTTIRCRSTSTRSAAISTSCEEIIDDQMWTLPKYRELLFLR